MDENVTRFPGRPIAKPPKRPKAKAPREVPLPQFMRQQAVQNSTDKDGFPVGKHGPVIMTWIQPPCFGMWILAGVELANSGNSQ